MAKKIFKYRGMTLEELQKLSDDEFMAIVPSRQRRTLKRGYGREAKVALEKILSGKKLKTHSREIIITPAMVGKKIGVHKGNAFADVLVQEEMIGHRLGEFAFSKKRVRHGKAGLGATSGKSATTRK